MNALVRSNPAAANLPAIVCGDFASLPAPIRKAIVKIDLAFPAGLANLAPGEVDIRNDVYAEAVEGFPGVIVVAALKHFLLNNPRNPFAPTPQDVHEACKKMRNQWVRAIAAYMIGDLEWRPPKWLADCPAPGTTGHPASIEDVRAAVKESYVWYDVREYEAGRSSDLVLARIRPEMFDKGEVERIKANRKAAMDEARRQHREYLEQTFGKGRSDGHPAASFNWIGA